MAKSRPAKKRQRSKPAQPQLPGMPPPVTREVTGTSWAPHCRSKQISASCAPRPKWADLSWLRRLDSSVILADRGEAHYHEALALAEPRGMRPLVAHCHLGLGKLYRRMGKREQGHEHLAAATTMYREMDMRFWLEQAEAETR